MRFKEIVEYDYDEPTKVHPAINKDETVCIKKGDFVSFEDLFASLIYGLHPASYKNNKDYESDYDNANKKFLHFYNKISINDKRLIAVQFFKVAGLKIDEDLSVKKDIRARYLYHKMYSKYFAYFSDFSEDMNYFSEIFKDFGSYKLMKNMQVLMNRLLKLDSDNVFGELIHFNDKNEKGFNCLLKKELNNKYLGLSTYTLSTIYETIKIFEQQNKNLVKKIKTECELTIEKEILKIFTVIENSTKGYIPYVGGIKKMFLSMSNEDLLDKGTKIWEFIKKDFYASKTIDPGSSTHFILLVLNSMIEIPGQMEDVREMEKSCFEKKGDYLLLNATRFIKLSKMFKMFKSSGYSDLCQIVDNLKEKKIFKYYQNFDEVYIDVEMFSSDVENVNKKHFYALEWAKQTKRDLDMGLLKGPVGQYVSNTWEKEILRLFETYLDISIKNYLVRENFCEQYLNNEIGEINKAFPDKCLSPFKTKYSDRKEDIPDYPALSWECPKDENLVELFSFLLFKCISGNFKLSELDVEFEEIKLNEQRADKKSQLVRQKIKKF